MFVKLQKLILKKISKDLELDQDLKILKELIDLLVENEDNLILKDLRFNNVC